LERIQSWETQWTPPGPQGDDSTHLYLIKKEGEKKGEVDYRRGCRAGDSFGK